MTYPITGIEPTNTSINTETLADDKIITAADQQYHLLDPGGESRNVTLSAESSSDGLKRTIINTADVAGELLTVKNDGDDIIDVVYKDEIGNYVCDGTNWKGGKSYPVNKPKTYFGSYINAFTGGAEGSVDGITEYSDGDVIFSMVAGVVYYHQYDASETGAESSPDIIIPDDNATGTGAWVLIATYIKSHQVAAQTLSGNRTLLVADKGIQFLDPGGSDRDVSLPAEASSTNLSFQIVNTADAAGENLTVKNDVPATIDVLLPGETGYYFCDGTDWKGGKLLPINGPFYVDAQDNKARLQGDLLQVVDTDNIVVGGGTETTKGGYIFGNGQDRSTSQGNVGFAFGGYNWTLANVPSSFSAYKKGSDGTTEIFKIDAGSNLILNGTAIPTAGASCVVLHDGSAGSAGASNASYLVSKSGEMWGYDSGNTGSQLTTHGFKILLDSGDVIADKFDDPLFWSFTHETDVGPFLIREQVNMQKALMLLEQLTGEKLIRREIIINDTTIDDRTKEQRIKEYIAEQSEADESTGEMINEIEVSKVDALETIEIDEKYKSKEKETKYKLVDGEVVSIEMQKIETKKVQKIRLKKHHRFCSDTGKFFRCQMPTYEEAKAHIESDWNYSDEMPKWKLNKCLDYLDKNPTKRVQT